MIAASWCGSHLCSKRFPSLAKLSQNLTKPNIEMTFNTPLNAATPSFIKGCLLVTHRWPYLAHLLTFARANEDFLGVISPVKIEFSESLKKGLPYMDYSDYAQTSSAKSGGRIGVLAKYKATHDAPSVFFCVLAFVHPFFSATVIIRAARKVMVGWMGAEKSAPVTLYAGYANPVQLTTSEIGVSGGGIHSQYKEAAIMATTLGQVTSKFQFRFLALPRADMLAKPCRISVEAISEKEARRVLAPHFILSLAARLPVREVALA